MLTSISALVPEAVLTWNGIWISRWVPNPGATTAKPCHELALATCTLKGGLDDHGGLLQGSALAFLVR